MIDLTSVQIFSDAQVLQILRMALVNSAFAKEYSANGKSVSQMSGAELQALIETYEWRIYRQNQGMFVVAANRPPE
jgi:hypothetical protein